LPIIGLYKIDVPGFEPYITPTLQSAIEVAAAGADIIALDATLGAHPDGDTESYIKMVQEATGLPVLADVSTFHEGVTVAGFGVEMVSTTLSGYTSYSRQLPGPDITMVHTLAGALSIPVIAEGRIATPEQARAALDAGAWAVVVGGAITRPRQITERFVKAVKGG
jgi:N-acylglucosamine-6-phosphate 2-epimerase